MKVKLNPMFEELSGQLGDLVFREVRGETIASRKPSGGAEPTEDQVAQRERFKLAAAYGKSVMGDQATLAMYAEAAKNKKMPVFALMVADFLHAPTIVNVDVSAYHGVSGDPIRIITSDDFSVVQVSILITGEDRKSTRLNSSHIQKSRMPSSA